ncbi:hypothetical protein, partial [Fusibacter sp. 3D3]|uniref:hypothetical protein n=1 Tax=Fusibacter sp. 3D3 TaxID=1048380 RepID=UPI001112CAC9
MKKQISLILIFFILLQLLSGINFLDDKSVKVADYFRNLNVFDFSTDVPKVTNGTAYRTIGFKATLVQNGHPYDAYIKMEQYKERDHTGLDGTPWVETKFHVPVSDDNGIKSENITSVYDTFKSKFQNDPTAVKEISEFFASDNSVIKLDAVLTKVTGNNVLGGSMTVTNGNASFDGIVYKTYDEFIGSGIGWSKTTKEQVLKEYYNIQLPFDAQPMIPVPKIMGTVNGERAERANHVFKEGQTIVLDGNDSTFQSKTKPLSYIWEYKKTSDLNYSPLATKSEGGTPFSSSLEVGTYDVRLKVSARYERAWDTTSVDATSTVIAKTKVTIEKNLNPLATAIITSPPEIMLEDTQNSISIPVTLNTKVLNVEQTDILSVELQLSTYEKDQKKSQFFYPSLSQSMAYSFTIPYYGIPKTQIFEGRAIVTLKGGG